MLNVILIGCNSNHIPCNKPPVVVLNPQRKLGSKTSSHYTVCPGDTLLAIARTTGNTLNTLMRYNNINSPHTIYPGQVLRISPEKKTINIIAKNTKLLKKSSNEVSKTSINSYKSNTLTASAKMHDFNILPSGNTIKWNWPTRGTIIEKFSEINGGNHGIDFSGKRGQAIYGSAAGRVVYAGNALRGYGNLIIIKHNENYLSAYAHNDKLLVKERDIIRAGQQIATMGNSGSNLVRLHFEIRYKGKSINPLHYLPKR